MLDPERYAAEALLEAARVLEAAVRGLKHRRHLKHLKPARDRIVAVLAAYFRRQEEAVLAEIKPHIKRELAISPAPIREALQEADAGEWVTIHGHPVLLGGGAAGTKERVERAKKSAVRTGQREQAIADKSEQVLSDAIGVPRTADNSAFDLRNDEIGIEVKTLVNGKNEKITMSKAALGRKEAERRADELRTYTVVVDRRTGGLAGKATYYYREGLGSFRLGSMTKATLSEIRKLVK